MLRKKNSTTGIKRKRNEIYFSIEANHNQMEMYSPKTIYSLYNKMFFRGKLPAIPISWSLELPDEVISKTVIARTAGKKPITAEQANKIHRKEPAYGWKKSKKRSQIKYRTVMIAQPKELLFNKSKFYHKWSDNNSLQTSGLSAHDRLSSLMLAMEHEIIHLILFIEGKESDHHPSYYQELASQLFGHNKSSKKIMIEIGPKKADDKVFRPTDGWGLKRRRQIKIRHQGKSIRAIIIKDLKNNRTKVFDVEEEKYLILPFRVSTII